MRKKKKPLCRIRRSYEQYPMERRSTLVYHDGIVIGKVLWETGRVPFNVDPRSPLSFMEEEK